ncbi:MAG: hypothetical protein K2X90_01385 [Candidatus Babeliaceae bacterium]|nr:hypothetical protein [Candidatus Babeliaceae bacterium]
MNTQQPFGEIIASSLTSWTIQSWLLDDYPPFGAIIEIIYQENKHFGVICDIKTGPKDASRTPFAFGKTIQELKQEQPHIFQLLQTTIMAIPLSYSDNKNLIYQIPKHPAPIHAFAQLCTLQELRIFFSNAHWIITFFNLAQQNALFDELLIAVLHNAHSCQALDKETLQEIIDIFCLLTQDDYRKLKIFLQRIEAFIY